MILFFYGPDTFRSRAYLKHSIDQFKRQRDPQGYNVVMLDGKKIEPSKLFAEMKAVPFLAEKRMVVVENILSSSNKELLQQLEQEISEKKLPESNIIIFWQGEALGKVKEVKTLQTILAKEKYAQEFALLTGAKLVEWIQKEIEKRGGKLESAAVSFIVENAGQDMWQLHFLLDQLVAFACGKAITLSDVQLFLNKKVDDNVFNMIEAMVMGNKKSAFTMLEEQRRLGEEDGKIFGLLIWQYRILMEMADLLEKEPHTSSDVIAKEVGIHPFVAKKNLGIVKKYSFARLQEIYYKLLEIDIKTKTGQADQSMLLDVFVRTVYRGPLPCRHYRVVSTGNVKRAAGRLTKK